MNAKRDQAASSNFINLHHLADLTTTSHTMTQLALLHASLARHVVLAGQENTVLLIHSAKPAFVRFLFLCLTRCLAQLALKGQTAAQLELGTIFQQVGNTLHPFR